MKCFRITIALIAALALTSTLAAAEKKPIKTSNSKSSSASKSSEKSARTSSANEKNKTTSRPEVDLSAAAVNPYAFDETLMSRLVFDYSNQERRNAGMSAFQRNNALTASAREHSQDMATRQYFSHKSKGLFNRTDPRDRVGATGYNPSMVAENIAMLPTFKSQTIRLAADGQSQVDTNRTSYRQLAADCVRMWMESPGHRANMMNGRLGSLGVGTAIGVKDNVPYVYLTQNFGG